MYTFHIKYLLFQFKNNYNYLVNFVMCLPLSTVQVILFSLCFKFVVKESVHLKHKIRSVCNGIINNKTNTQSSCLIQSFKI